MKFYHKEHLNLKNSDSILIIESEFDLIDLDCYKIEVEYL